MTDRETRYKERKQCIGCDGYEFCRCRNAMCTKARWYKNSKDRNWKQYRKTEYKEKTT